jgi:hypothetical protein
LICDTRRISEELGFTEKYTPEAATCCAAKWKRGNSPAEINEKGFDYKSRNGIWRKIRG